jgi:predicted transcriptional regulator
MADTQITSFVITRELKQQLESWAKEADRTTSAQLRQILQAEAKRREAQQQQTTGGRNV